jgi:hypothetical protein
MLAGTLLVATAAGCAAISGLDSLEEAPTCSGASCDGGLDTTVDAPAEALPDTAPDTVADSTLDAAEVADSSFEAGDAADAPDASETADAADAADASDAKDAADAGDTAEAAVDCGALNTITNCGACGRACDTTTSQRQSCDGVKCSYPSCKTGFTDCDKILTGDPNTDGCECATPLCCGSSCAKTHKNCIGTSCGSLGQNYFISDPCKEVGTPGLPTTYTYEMGINARSASPIIGTPPDGGGDGEGTCTPPGDAGTVSDIIIRQTSTICFVWAYTGPLAGRVYMGASCACPTSSSPTWN